MITSKVFNPETLLHYTEQDRDLAAQLISMGKSDMPDFLEKAEQLSGRSQYVEASRSIHSLKGVAGAIGAERLFEKSFDCEMMLKKGEETEMFESCFKDLRNELEELLTDPLFQKYSND